MYVKIKKFEFLKIKYGEILILSPLILHGIQSIVHLKVDFH